MGKSPGEQDPKGGERSCDRWPRLLQLTGLWYCHLGDEVLGMFLKERIPTLPMGLEVKGLENSRFFSLGATALLGGHPETRSLHY